MKIKNPFSDLTRFELVLWILSVVITLLSYIISKGGDILTAIASAVGVTALIFVAKGYVLGQILTVVFSVFYGIISYFFRYYGEMITYLFMTAPIAVMSVISWIRHPYEGTKEVEVSRINKKQVLRGTVLSGIITLMFYFILSALGNKNMFLSTLSITTSFLACYFTFLRSPYYAIMYSANDIVLIILWIMATMESIDYLPMVICFTMFLVNDIYGFVNWQKIAKKQQY
ncbi:MAG: nicotinamide riboside transporter PnuC [Clostridia bacterium]|nr:nicotinamide riboside transporter PnuC [Clostridia bacterium]